MRVSIIGFDYGCEKEKYFDKKPVASIHADLTGDIDITVAKHISSNDGMVARGIETGGPFELTSEETSKLSQTQGNELIVVPIVNGKDITDNRRFVSVIDFAQTPDVSPKEYKEIYNFLYGKWQKVLNDDTIKRKPSFREHWWEFRRSGTKLRELIKGSQRYIATPRVAKHRLFVWLNAPTIPDSALFAIARDDDYFFGVLHSKLHECWSLRMGTSLEDRPRYTPTTTFETFPFPYVPGSEDTTSPEYQAIAAAAKTLHEERQQWLDGTHQLGKGGREKDRTLTNLYNALTVFRGEDTMKIKAIAGEFAPRLAELHEALDKAVCAAYGWSDDILSDEETILRHLLELNLERAKG